MNIIIHHNIIVSFNNIYDSSIKHILLFVQIVLDIISRVPLTILDINENSAVL